jgi:hypothetical protein
MILCALMMIAGVTTSIIAKIDFSLLFLPYFATAAAVTTISLLLTMFWWILRLAIVQADDPLKVIADKLRNRLPLLLLPVVIFPLFLVAFTTTKTAIPFIVGFRWDAFWADADKLVFGDDVFRLTHRWFGTGAMLLWQWFYTVAWGFVLFFSHALVALNGRRSRVVVFYTAMFGTWLLGGFLLAYTMSAAGPVFAHLVEPQLLTRFLALRGVLDHSLAVDAPILSTQRYLSSAIAVHVAVKGGGISAMPSIHLGAVSIYVLASRNTKWMIPALLFWAVIFVCSAYFGYHYWVDGIVAALVALVCWAVAERCFQDRLPGYAALPAQLAERRAFVHF